MPVDYSKWGKIEVSDDEDDTHPNIDTPSLFRWRHQARLERMAEMKQQKEEVESKKKEVKSREQVNLEKNYNNLQIFKQIDEELAKCTDEKLRVKLELEKTEIQKQEEEFLRKEKELADKERLQPWNIDTIGKEAWSKSVINKASDKKPETPKKNEEEDDNRMVGSNNVLTLKSNLDEILRGQRELVAQICRFEDF